MDEKFKKLLEEFGGLNLPDGQYAIYGSGPMAVRGIKGTQDLDVIVSDALYQQLKSKYPKDTKKERIKIGEIEIYPVWAWNPKMKGLEKSLERAELIKGFRYVCLEDLIKWKKRMSRPKDIEHIKMIEDYLQKQVNRAL